MKQLVLALDPPLSSQSTAQLSSCLDHTPSPTSSSHDVKPDAQASIDAVQLERLAKAILSKDYHDLAALAESNPLLLSEWQVAFSHRRAEAEKRARYWASAAAALATVKGMSILRHTSKHASHLAGHVRQN